MKLRLSFLLLSLLAGLAGAAASSATAATITYTVDQIAGTSTVKGTITTDGTLGALTDSNFLNWNLTIDFGGSIGALNLGGPAAGDLLTVFPQGSGVTANATTLLYDFATPDQTGLVISRSLGFLQPFYGVAFVGAHPDFYARSVTTEYRQSSSAPVSFFTTHYASAAQIAAVATTPIPASLPLFTTGLAGMCLFAWSGKRRKVAPTAEA
jgi:hypothetical protein